MSTELQHALEQVAQRFRQFRLWVALAGCWLAWSVIGGVLLFTSPDDSGGLLASSRVVLGFLGGAIATALVCAWFALRSARDPRSIARRIENKHPDLTTALLAAIDEETAAADGRRGYLQTAVINETLAHRRTHDWNETVPSWTLNGAKFAHAATLGLLIVVSLTMFGNSRSRAAAIAARGDLGDGYTIRVEPGNAEIERGTSLLVVARFDAAVPPDATLVVDGAAETSLRRKMTRSLEDPAFAGRVPTVENDLAYRIEFAGQQSENFRVTVFDYPEVLRTDAELTFPSYSGLQPKTVEDIRHVTAVEGTTVKLLFRLNKEVISARLVDQQGAVTQLALDEADPLVATASFALAESNRLKVELVDSDGRINKTPTQIALHVVPNKPPVVAVARPSRDVRVSPLEELTLAAKLEDDFGVVRHGISYSLAGEEPRELVLETGEASRRFEAQHLLDFESLATSPDQLLTYYFWAEDIGPDGEPRRSMGDMFFAEVRPFEEIFRQGEQPPAGAQQQQQGQVPQGGAQQAMQLAELQKEIINGTWRMIRREIGSKLSAKFNEDAKLLVDAQQSAIAQATELSAQLQDPESQSHVGSAIELMEQSVERLSEALDSSTPAPLQKAIVSEQAAYQALLKLRDREFEVTRGQQQQGGGGGAGGPSQRQLDQLELTNEENRYEQRNAARPEEQSEQDQQQRETRQILSRLRELAQRQEDLNERLKEIQAALEAAKDEAAREEIERQLKRLREQQQQILRDADELRERLENEQNRDRLAEAREQVEQSRERIRQASESLEEGRLSQALTEGTRAERELNELSEKLREETSSRFTEAMTQMRDQARRLDEAQNRLTEQLEQMGQDSSPSLRQTDKRRQAESQLAEQRKQFEELLERMRTTVQDAEETQPLLAEALYEAVQQAERQSIDEVLDAAQQLTDLGVPEEAAKASRHAGQGIEQLREGVEKAAESVLGDETSALRLAQSELERLAEQLDREIAQATGQNPSGQQDPTDRQAEPPGEGSSSGSDREQQQQRPAGPSGAGTEQQRDRTQQQSSTDQTPQSNRQTDPSRQPANPSDQQTGQQGQQPGQRGAPPGQSEQPGRQSEQDRQPGEQSGQQGQQPGPSSEQTDQQGQPSGEGSPSQQAGQQRGQQGQQPQEQSAGGSNAGGQEGTRDRQNQSPRLRGGEQDQVPLGPRRNAEGGGARGGLDRLLDEFDNGGIAGPVRPDGPIIGDNFRDWSDRLRDVEELLQDPELRAEAARVRDRARVAREDYKRHSKEPDWGKLQDLIADPLHELRDRVAEEVRRRESPDALVPIDRDPVPPAFAEGVRRYYERLGSGQ